VGVIDSVVLIDGNEERLECVTVALRNRIQQPLMLP
jgi:hypothetical protein